MQEIRNIFLDRDGTLIHDRHYLHDPDGVELLPGAGEAMARLARRGMRFFLVTNQSGIGRGYFTDSDYHACNARLEALLSAFGVSFVDTAFCPHGPEEACHCRKPGLGMWHALRDRHGLDPASCAMVGDKRADVAFGLNAGFAAVVLVRTGKGEAEASALGLRLLEPSQGGATWLESPKPGQPNAQAVNLPAALDLLVPREGEEA